MKADGLLSAKHLLDFRKELGNCIESHCVPIGITLEVDRLERQMLRLVETFGLIVTERHRNYRKSVQYGSSPEPDIVSTRSRSGEKFHIKHILPQGMWRIKHTAYPGLDIQESTMNASGQEMIPAVFAPFPVRLPRFDELGPVSPYSVRINGIHCQQITQHIAMIMYIIIHSDYYGVREIGQCRNKLAIGTYVNVIIPDFKDRIVFGEPGQFFRDAGLAEL